MNDILSKSLTHVLDLPSAGRIIFRVRFTPEGIFAILEAARRINNRRDRRALSRWLRKIQRPLNSDPRPMQIVTVVNGRFSALGIEENDRILLFGGNNHV